ncbi:hypothetical protein Cni_G06627 [Canna indica]|uniref:glutamate--cysteine ligase n=1 Tax=Canna indica TaxID=4628 RepID=A0AAQ3JYZ9_9LILI|nr:hypothetical protein Cni_G06627 [Canna indica]
MILSDLSNMWTVEYALDVPMYFVYRIKKYINCTGMSFRIARAYLRNFMQGKLPSLPGELPTLNDWENHLMTIFPEVRLKRYLEMRGADGGPWRRLCALPAFWKQTKVRPAMMKKEKVYHKWLMKMRNPSLDESVGLHQQEVINEKY